MNEITANVCMFELKQGDTFTFFDADDFYHGHICIALETFEDSLRYRNLTIGKIVEIERSETMGETAVLPITVTGKIS